MRLTEFRRMQYIFDACSCCGSRANVNKNKSDDTILGLYLLVHFTQRLLSPTCRSPPSNSIRGSPINVTSISVAKADD